MKHWVLRQLNEGLFYPLYDYCRHERVTAEEQDTIVEWLRKKMAANTGENFTKVKSCISALELNSNVTLSEGVYLYLAEYAPQEIFSVDNICLPPNIEQKAFASMLPQGLAEWDILIDYAKYNGLSIETQKFLQAEYEKLQNPKTQIICINLLVFAAEKTHEKNRQLNLDSLKILLTGPTKVDVSRLAVWHKQAMPWLLSRYTPEELAPYIKRFINTNDFEKRDAMQFIEFFKLYTENQSTCGSVLSNLLHIVSKTPNNIMLLINKYPNLFIYMITLSQIEISDAGVVEHFFQTACQQQPEFKAQFLQAALKRPHAFSEEALDCIFRNYTQQEIIGFLQQCKNNYAKLSVSKTLKSQYPYIKKYVD